MVLLNNRNRMREDGIHPDVFTFTAFVQLYANDGEFGLAKEAFERIRDHGIEPDQHAYCAMIVACNRAGEFDAAEELFMEMKAVQIPPDLAIYNTMISIRSRIGQEVESLIEEMHGSGIRSDHVTDWIIANKKRKSMGGSFAGLEEEPSSLLEITQAMRELGRAGDVEQVLRLFRKAKQMGSDVAVYNAAIQALIIARRHTAAKHVLNDMRNQLIKFDVATFSMCMVLLARDPNTERETPYRLLHEMDVEGVLADTAIFNAMLRIKSVRPGEVLREMQMRKLQPDNYTKRALIAVYLRRRQPIRALRTLQKTEDWDARSVNQVIHSLRQHGEKDLADKLVRYSLERGVDLDSQNVEPHR
uniref:Pentacotripeptide-repeat region of PRORP domain-containing protein n=1 Tax=Rhodosorus marinus TaxID=101924 RepID=A0A7S3EG78_9RHOD|mmetsp:Transcript_31640/g.122487  ORF Transcript_31640/g.122487 Transcript_31640/m.122487 type:complete len:359 (+) Transcript_31640:1661-2737(+)